MPLVGAGMYAKRAEKLSIVHPQGRKSKESLRLFAASAYVLTANSCITASR